MIFTDILAEARRIAKASTSSYSTTDITSSANSALEREIALIRDAQGRWQFDDSNNTDFPFATTALVANQQDYTLDINHYRLERVEVLDQDGNWNKLIPIDQTDIYDQSLTDFLKGAGTPKYYDKTNNSLFLYPKPNYNQTASLKVFYERGPSYFTTADTTKSPGFNPLFHRLIPLWCAYDYAFINQLKIAPTIRAEITQMEDNMMEYYSLRDIDDHIRLTTKRYSFR